MSRRDPRTELQLYVSVIAKVKNGERPRSWEVKFGGTRIGKIFPTDEPRKYRLVVDSTGASFVYEGSRVGSALTMAALVCREEPDD